MWTEDGQVCLEYSKPRSSLLGSSHAYQPEAHSSLPRLKVESDASGKFQAEDKVL